MDAEHQPPNLAVGVRIPRGAPAASRCWLEGADRLARRVAVVAAADGSPAAWPQLPAPDRSAAAGNGSGPRDSRARVRELVAHERATGTRLHAREVAAAAGISQRRAYELLCALRAEEDAS